MKNKKVLFGIIIGVIIIIALAIVGYFIFLKKGLMGNIESLQVEYAPGMDYSEALEKNTNTETPFIEMQEIKLSKEETEQLKKKLNSIGKEEKKKDFETTAIIKVNKDNTLYLGKEIGKYETKKKTTYVEIPNSVYQEINKLIEKNNDKVLTKTTFEKFVIKKEGAVITLSNKDNIKIVENAIPYYKVNIADDFTTYDNGYKEYVVIDDKMIIYLYSSKIGYVKTQEESYYAIFPYDLEKAVTSIYEVSIK